MSTPTPPNNLPLQPTSFVGREREAAEVKARLGGARLLTLTGPGGTGKSRLSLQAAGALMGDFADGVWLVELAPLSDPALVAQAVAQTVGVKEQAGQPMGRTLAEALRGKRLLLLLDNCEHLVDACATLAGELLRGCPDVHILASSREPLNVSGEQTFHVPPLSLPDPKQPQTAQTLARYEAARLFAERAAAARPGFAVTEDNALAVAEVCSRLDGIPLAIELAAARVRSLSVDEVNARLDDRFRLLTGGARDRLPRQQTLRALIDWSYDLLTEPEKALLRRLSVFAGGWDIEAAEAVCVGHSIEDWEVLDLLTGLTDKSLAVAEAGDGRTRLRLLETIRRYAGDRLAESGEEEIARSRHAAWCLALAERAEVLLAGPGQADWLARLETEHDNLRAALDWCEDQPGAQGTGLRLAGALGRFWQVRGYFAEGREWLARVLGHAGATDPAARAKALHGAGLLAWNQGDYAAARAFHEESLALRRASGDLEGIAASLNGLGNVACDQWDFAAARAFHEESLALRRQADDLRGVAASLNNLGNVAGGQGDMDSARTFYEESLAVCRELRDPQGVSAALNNLGVVAQEQGDQARARALHEESLALKRELGDRRGIVMSLGNLGNVALEQGDLASAEAYHAESLAACRPLGDRQSIAAAAGNLGILALRRGAYESARGFLSESLSLRRALEDRQGVASTLRDFAALAQAQGLPRQAAALLGASDALRVGIDAALTLKEQDDLDAQLSAARAALGDAAFSEAFDAGRSLTLDAAVDRALSEAQAGAA